MYWYLTSQLEGSDEGGVCTGISPLSWKAVMRVVCVPCSSPSVLGNDTKKVK